MIERTDKPAIIVPMEERGHPSDPGGIQRLFRFDNGYGASVVRFWGSYGYAAGKWELAVIRWEADSFGRRFTLCYDTPITDDVLGWLSEEEVAEKLGQIAALPRP